MKSKKVVVAGGKDVIKVYVEIDGQKLHKRFLLHKGRVPQVAKEYLQEATNDILYG